MQAVRFQDKQVVLRDAPEPSGDGVLVKVRACGICGSDVAILDSGFPISGIPGHEISGELADGTPVAIEPFDPCGACRYCLAGDHQVCVRGNEMIYGVGRDGGMAERVIVPARSIVALPRNLDATTGCLVEPLAVAVHGVRRTRVDGTTRVLVIGGGSIGQCAVAAAVATGARVDLVARHAAQVEAGRLLGAEVVESGAGGDYDVVFDCAGTPGAIESACDALRPRGALVMLASSWGALELPGFVVAAKELDFLVSTMYGQTSTTRDVDAAARILGEREEIAQALISHRYPLAQAPEAFLASRDRKGGAIKVVLEP